MKKIIMLLLMATILNSCVRSLYPLTENEKEMIFKKELLGKWENKYKDRLEYKDGVEYLIDTLKGQNGKVYSIIEIIKKNTFKSGDTSYFSDTSYFTGMLVKIKGNYIMDCYFDIEEMQGKKLGESEAKALLRTHIFIKISNIEQNSITLSVLDPHKLSMLSKQKKINIRHEVINKEEILLIEKSKTLKQKIIELEKFPSVYGEINRLIRIK
jgi:hypothetical protein